MSDKGKVYGFEINHHFKIVRQSLDISELKAFLNEKT